MNLIIIGIIICFMLIFFLLYDNYKLLKKYKNILEESERELEELKKKNGN